MRDQGGDVQCTAWRLLDAQFWGVPQRRKRIYLVNDFGNGRAGQILFECESVLGYHSQGGAEKQGNSGNSENSLTGTDCRGMAEDADGQMKLDFGRTADRIYINAKTSVTLMGNAGGGGGKTGLYLLPVYTIAGNVIGRNEKNGGNQLGVNQDIAPTLTGADRHAVAYAAGFLPKAGAKAGGIGYTEKASPTLMSQHRPAVVYGYTQSGYGEFKEGVGTLKKSRGAAGGGSETLAVIMERIAAAVKYRVRRLTPLECERLDGFPDEWTRYGASGKEMSDNARYMALGNSIAVPCAERVFIGIKKAESEEKHMEKSMTPLNGIVEPDFLEYLDKTFKRWQQLAAQGVTLGSREIAKLTDTVYGAKLNARYGFEAVARREPDEEGQDRFTLMIYKNREAVENDPPLYHFTTPIHR